MGEELTRLRIEVLSDEVARAERRLHALERRGGRTERAMGRMRTASLGLSSALTKVLVPLVGIGALTGVSRRLLEAAQSSQRLEGQLITATGSADDAKAALEGIRDLAQEMPFQVQEVTGAFVRLVNLGLTPSERALVSYGNTASAMGKTLNDFIEAVADASVGEFERLKEFGIKASSQGDQVVFRFRGQATEIKKEAASIEEYLIRLGEENFGDAMENQMATINGAISNLQDQWNSLWVTVAETGAADLMEGAIRGVITALEDLNASIDSGEMGTRLDAYGELFVQWGESVEYILDILEARFGKTLPGRVAEALDAILDDLTELPVNVEAIVESVGAYFGFMLTDIESSAESTYKIFKFYFEQIKDEARAAAFEIADLLSVTDGDTFDYDGVVANIRKRTKLQVQLETDRFNKLRDERADDLRDSITAIWDERDANLEAFRDKLNASKKLREEYDALKASQDRIDLGQFGVGGGEDGDGSGSGGSGGKKGKSKVDKRLKEFERLQELLTDETEHLRKTYEDRLSLIEDYTAAGSEKQLDMIERVMALYDEDYQSWLENEQRKSENLLLTLEEQEGMIRQSYENRRQSILALTEVTEREKQELLSKLAQQERKQLSKNERERNTVIRGAAEQLFGGLAEVTRGFVGEQSDAYRVMFAISKSFAITDSLIKIQQGIASALSLTWPANLIAMAEVAAHGAAIVSNIEAITYQPKAYATGGLIPSGKVGLVGEAGPEVVRGPAMVTSAAATAGMSFNREMAPVNIVVNNHAGAEVRTTTRETQDGRLVEIAVERAKGEISNDLRDGRGSVPSAIEDAYGLRRGGRD